MTQGGNIGSRCWSVERVDPTEGILEQMILVIELRHCTCARSFSRGRDRNQVIVRVVELDQTPHRVRDEVYRKRAVPQSAILVRDLNVVAVSI